MKQDAIALRPSYWANVSGGKDSLLMLKIILENPDKYPLNGVVHFELEIDYPFIRNVIDYMESECKKHNIPFVRIRPTKKWMDLYQKWGFPNRRKRWCNSHYKLDAKDQHEQFMRSLGYYVIHYIGYCADEVQRFAVRKNANVTEVYPLVQEQIREDAVLLWARKQPIFNNYYKTNRRCGCMWCPMSDRMNMAYLLKYYPQEYEKMIEMMDATEVMLKEKQGKPVAIMDGNPKYNARYIDNIIRTKWIKKLEEKEKEKNG